MITLDAGEILIMGGDQAYPQSSALEYQHRLIDPYNWAFTPAETGLPDQKERKLFALPGNHDWYDGLGAFDSLFCSARDRISEGDGKLIGGWRCKQHRSYFAIRLPDDWWIWGADIQLGGVLDDPQRDYFDIMSKETGAGSKIMLCLAEPSWTHENYDNLFEIVTIAQSNGAKVCAVLAGDLHHYSRYVAVRSLSETEDVSDKNSPLLGTQFITCGGGGAFAHATHGLKSSLELKWPDAGAIDADRARSTKKGVQAFRGSLLGEDARSGLRNVKVEAKSYEMQPKAIYPSRNTSRLLCLKNLWLPFHNTSFALFVGIIYLLYAWVFQVSIGTYDTNRHLAANAKLEAAAAERLNDHLEVLNNRAEASGAGGDNALVARDAIRSLERWRRAVAERATFLNGPSILSMETAISGLAKRAVKFGLDWDQASSSVKDSVLELRKKLPGGFPIGLQIDGDLGNYFGLTGSQFALAAETHKIARSRVLAEQLKQSATSAAAAARSIAERAEVLKSDAGAGEEVTMAAHNLAEYARGAERQASAFAAEIRPIDARDVAEHVWAEIKDPNRVSVASQLNPAFFFLVIALLAGLIYYADVEWTSRWRLIPKAAIGSLHFLAHMSALLLVSAVVGLNIDATEEYLTAISLASILGMIVFFAAGSRAALIVTPVALMTAIAVVGTDAGMSSLRLLWTSVAQHVGGASAENFIANTDDLIASGLKATWANPYVLNFWAVILLVFATIMLGGLLGALIFGIYWSLMSTLFARHSDDAFGALGLRHYKHFLRMKFEKDRLTIYPVAIDRVPGRRGWVPARPEHTKPPFNGPKIVPKMELGPHLIEDPIVISAPAR